MYSKAFRRDIIISAGIIVFFILFFGIGFYWFTGIMSDQSQAIAQNRATLLRTAQAAETLANLKRSALLADKQQKFLETFLPRGEQLLDFPHWVEGIAATNKISVNVKFQGEQIPSQENVPGYVRFGMTANGTPETLNAFLKDIESNIPRYFVALDSVDLVYKNPVFELSAQGRVFSQ